MRSRNMLAVDKAARLRPGGGCEIKHQVLVSY
jgi:hypothetical protein